MYKPPVVYVTWIQTFTQVGSMYNFSRTKNLFYDWTIFRVILYSYNRKKHFTILCVVLKELSNISRRRTSSYGKILPHFLVRQLPVRQKMAILEDDQHLYSLLSSPPTTDVYDGIPFLQEKYFLFWCTIPDDIIYRIIWRKCKYLTIQGSRKLFLLWLSNCNCLRIVASHVS